MKKCLFFIAFAAMASLSLSAAASDDVKKAGQTEHQIYLESTDYELHVYRIYGKKPGNTVMIIGGIHGNEPGGFLAADHYKGVSLEQGNLIVVPRTNLASILSNHRGNEGDLNRRFSKTLDESLEPDKIVSILKELMGQSDLVLNLHDGSGFYREKWIDKLHNPFRYGQAVMSDSDVYQDKNSGETVLLAEMARRVVAKVNAAIGEEEFKFSFANHDSINPDTKYPEMRKTATYHALTEYGIPAYGIETSKSLPDLSMKVEHQILVINAFLDEFQVRMATPGVNVAEALVEYLIFNVNGSELQGVAPGEDLKVGRGDKIRLEKVISNYDSGLYLDFVGQGGRNDNLREVIVDKPLRVVLRKDSSICCSFNVVPVQKQEASVSGVETLKGDYFIVDVNGITKLVSPENELDVILGDVVTVKDFIGPNSSKGINVNFQGFVGNPADNRGEDRGYPADTSKDLLKNWSQDKDGKRYQIAAKSGKRVISAFMLKIIEPDFKYLIVNNSLDNRAVIARNGDALDISGMDEIVIEDIITNMKDSSSLKVKFNNSGKSYRVGDTIALKSGSRDILTIYSGEKLLGNVSFVRPQDSTEKAAR